MGTILVSEFTTVDGSIGAPTFTFPYGFTDAMGEAMGALTGRSTALLLGRTTWEESGPAWSGREMADDPGAPFFNDTSKHVVSGTLDDVSAWRNSTLVGGYSAEAIQALKDGVDGGIYATAAAPWCAPCSPTDSSTSCTCGSTRSPPGPVRGCSPTVRRRPRCRCSTRRPSTTGCST